jgi:hypothetical protein
MAREPVLIPSVKPAISTIYLTRCPDACQIICEQSDRVMVSFYHRLVEVKPPATVRFCQIRCVWLAEQAPRVVFAHQVLSDISALNPAFLS